MEELLKHKAAFDNIIQKYGLDKEEQANKIADFITGQHDGVVSLHAFCEEFGVELDEARIFLSFIAKGLAFKEDVLDKR